MTGKDIIKMSLKEVRRLKVVQEAIGRHITQKAAALMIGLSERQVRRMIKAVREQSERGIIHKSRGWPSNRKIGSEVRERALGIYKKKYSDFGPTLASEKLKEMDGIDISDETLRGWLIEGGLWQGRRKRSSHRQWRPRKECFGEMVQMDGSHHDWLEGRGSELALMGYRDDATNTVYARFYDYEGTMPAMDSFKGYVKKYGLPQSVYLDRHTTYKSTRKLTEMEKLDGIEPMSQFERALNELGVEVIHAYSPQAKGRVERLFGTLQDRLIKEMRLRGVKNKEEGNEFLEVYLPEFNKKFKVFPANDTDVHIKLPLHFDLDKYLCIKTERTVRNDNTIGHNGRLYQIEGVVKAKKVVLEERVDGSMRIMGNGEAFKYREITERPVKVSKVIAKRPKVRIPYTPSRDHPWRRHGYFGKKQEASAK